jgi:hypothetical protein
MSNKSNNKVTQVTMKLKDVDPEQFHVDKVKMKNGDVIPLVKYGPDKQTLNVQYTNIKLRQYGLQPGETLSNGKKNEYYQGEDARLSLRIPFDPKCCVSTNPDDEDETNEDTIKTEIEILKKIDARIKNVFYSVADVDSDDKEKYNSIFRKPAKSKAVKGKPVQEEKEKYNFVKCKFDTDGDAGDKRILTKFYKMGDDKDATLLNDMVSKTIKMEEVEKLVTYNSEVVPMIQFSKIWTQSTGAWGVTLKLKMLRVKQSSYTVREDAEFLNSDDEAPKKTPSKQAPTKVAASAQVEEDSDSDSDQESDNEPTQVQAKPAAKKAVAVVESSDSDSSDEEVKPAKKTPSKPVTKSKKSTV